MFPTDSVNVIRALEKIPSNIRGIPKFKLAVLNLFSRKGFGYGYFPGNKKILVDLDDITEVPLWLGLYPRDVYQFLESNLSDDSCFVDCGANIGLWSVLALGVTCQKNGLVYSFEPNGKLFERLCSTQKLNRAKSQWQIFNMGLSDRDGKATMHVDKTVHQVSTLNPQEEFSQRMDVDISRLDSIDFKTKVGGIKIDVEGHEYEVLKGACETINTFRPWLVVELNSHYANASSIMDWNVGRLLFEIGYQSTTDHRAEQLGQFCRDVIFYHPDCHDPSTMISFN